MDFCCIVSQYSTRLPRYTAVPGMGGSDVGFPPSRRRQAPIEGGYRAQNFLQTVDKQPFKRHRVTFQTGFLHFLSALRSTDNKNGVSQRLDTFFDPKKTSASGGACRGHPLFSSAAVDTPSPAVDWTFRSQTLAPCFICTLFSYMNGHTKECTFKVTILTRFTCVIESGCKKP